MDAAALEAALSMRSAHAGEVRDDDLARLRERMDKGEKAEAMEARMAEVTSRDATCFHCAQCDRTTLREPTMCRAEGHTITTERRKQYHFRCENCSHTQYAFRSVLAVPCPQCVKSVWKPVSVYRLHTTYATLAPTFHPTGGPVENSLRTGSLYVPSTTAADD